MIRDRGRIKWTAMMLPEHVKLLRDWAKEDMWEQPIELDEQKMEEINEFLEEAKEEDKEVAIRYYGAHHYEIAKGKIRTVDPIKQEIQVINEKGDIYFVPFQKIVDVDE